MVLTQIKKMSILVFNFESTILDSDAFLNKRADKAQYIVYCEPKIKRE